MPAKIPVLSQVGTVKVGICTLLFLAGACGFLTVWYEHPEQALGKSWWIRVPLVILALNLFSITVTRFRRSWSQFGMISTHAGLITILVGAFVTSVVGINGTVELTEGESTSKYYESGQVIAVKENRDALPLEQPVTFGAAPMRESVEVEIEVPGGTTVSVSKYYHRFREHDEVLDGGPEPNPCLELTMASQHEGPYYEYLFDEDGRRPIGQIEGYPVMFDYGPIESEARIQEAVSAVEQKRMGQVFVQAGQGLDPQVIEVASSLGKDVAISGTPYTLHLDKFLPTFQLTEDKQEVSVDDRARNPVVLATLTGPQGTEKKRIFPMGMEPPHGAASTWPDGFSVSYHVVSYLTFYRLPDGRHFAVGSLLDDSTKALPVTSGQPIEVKWLGFVLRPVYLSRAHVKPKHDNANTEDSPAAFVTVRNGAASASGWVRLSDRQGWTPFKVGGGEVYIGFQAARNYFSLPFTATLDKFIEENYEGSRSPMAWESHLTVRDDEKGRTFQYPIRMNEPLFYRGWKFFQSGKDQDPESGVWTSVLSVSWDPGQWFIYVGCVFVVAGVLFLFYAKQAVVRWESRRLAARGASPKSTAPEPTAESAKA